jgi:pimeloyl-ACP methyl ester carboxylesterase
MTPAMASSSPRTTRTASSRRAPLWARIRRIWATVGTIALVAFTGWSALAFRASGQAKQALASDARAEVTRGEGVWRMDPRDQPPRRAGLVFFPGGLVDPAAYAPLVRAAAEAGFPAVLVELPRRGAFGGADDPRVFQRAHAAMAATASVRSWVAAGHSRGGAVAARFASIAETSLAGLVLIGTSHPRDFSLAALTIPVVKVLGSRDCVADMEKSEANRRLLPPAARWIVIEGANHSQFGSYGFQPGDCFASIDRARQHAVTVEAMLEALRAADR